MPETARPTKEDIEKLIAFCGATIKTLPYSANGATAGTSGQTQTAALTSQNSAGFWGKFWYRVAREMKFHRQEFEDELSNPESAAILPQNWAVRIPNTASRKVNSAVDQVNFANPRVTVTCPEGFKTEADRARIERVFSAFGLTLIKWEQAATDQMPAKEQTTNTMAEGLGARYLVVDAKKLLTKPKRKRGETEEEFAERQKEFESRERRTVPFAIKSIHPLNLMYDRSGIPPEWLVIREPTTWRAIKADFPDWKDPLSRQTTYLEGNPQPVVYVEYWTATHYACFADGEPLLNSANAKDVSVEGIARNPYGFIPCWPSAGGWGAQDPFGRPEYELKGLLADNLSALLKDAAVENVIDVYRWRASYGPKVIVSGPDQRVSERILQDIMGNPMRGVSIPPGYKVTELNPSAVPPALLGERQSAKEEVDSGTVYDVASGSGSPTEAAARTRMRLFQIDKRWATAVLNIQETMEESIKAAIYMTRDVIKRPLGATTATPGMPPAWESVKPDEIPDGIVVKVDLVGDSEEEKARKQQVDDARLKEKSMDLVTYLQRREENPELVLQGLAADTVREQALIPALVQAATGQIPRWAVEVLAEEGVQFTPEELQGVDQQMQAEEAAAQEQAAMQAAGMGGQQQAMGGAQPQQGGVTVGVGGAQLPGEQVGENPKVIRPNSPEALTQQLQQGLQPPQHGGPRVRVVQ